MCFPCKYTACSIHAFETSCKSHMRSVAHMACRCMHACCGMQADSVVEGFAPLVLEDTDTVEAWFSLGAPQLVPARAALTP